MAITSQPAFVWPASRTRSAVTSSTNPLSGNYIQNYQQESQNLLNLLNQRYSDVMSGFNTSMGNAQTSLENRIPQVMDVFGTGMGQAQNELRGTREQYGSDLSSLLASLKSGFGQAIGGYGAQSQKAINYAQALRDRVMSGLSGYGEQQKLDTAQQFENERQRQAQELKRRGLLGTGVAASTSSGVTRLKDSAMRGLGESLQKMFADYDTNLSGTVTGLMADRAGGLAGLRANSAQTLAQMGLTGAGQKADMGALLSSLLERGAQGKASLLSSLTGDVAGLLERSGTQGAQLSAALRGDQASAMERTSGTKADLSQMLSKMQQDAKEAAAERAWRSGESAAQRAWEEKQAALDRALRETQLMASNPSYFNQRSGPGSAYGYYSQPINRSVSPDFGVRSWANHLLSTGRVGAAW